MTLPCALPIAPNQALFLPVEALPPSAWHGHIPFAAWLVGALRPSRIVELGTHHGASYLAFCQAVRALALPTRCVAVDTWAGDAHAGFYGDEVLAALRALHDPHYAGFSTLLRMTFDDALAEVEDGSVDLLHIDGLHTYEAARHDFETWLPKLSARAVVLFHDIAEHGHGFGVWRLWDELKARHPGFAFAHAHGLGVLMVGGDVPAAVAALAALDAADVTRVRGLFAALGEGVAARARALDLEARLAGAEQGVQAYRGHAEGLERDRDTLQAETTGLREGLAIVREELAANRARLEGAEHHAAGLSAGIEAYRAQAEALECDRARLQGELQGQAAGIAALQAELSERQAACVDAVQRLAAAEAKGEAASVAHAREVAESARAVAETRDALARATAAYESRIEAMRADHQAEVDGLQARVDAQADEIAAMLRSRSWRATAWLRGLSRLLRGGA